MESCLGPQILYSTTNICTRKTILGSDLISGAKDIVINTKTIVSEPKSQRWWICVRRRKRNRSNNETNRQDSIRFVEYYLIGLDIFDIQKAEDISK